MISVFKKYNGEILYVFVFLKRAIMKLTQLKDIENLQSCKMNDNFSIFIYCVFSRSYGKI